MLLIISILKGIFLFCWSGFLVIIFTILLKYFKQKMSKVWLDQNIYYLPFQLLYTKAKNNYFPIKKQK